MHIPIIVGMGGVNAAGRTSDHQSYRRMIIDELDLKTREKTLASLAVMMDLVTVESNANSNDRDKKIYRDSSAGESGELLTASEVINQFGIKVLEGTLVRKIEKSYFDVESVHWQPKATLKPDPSLRSGKIQFVILKNQIPKKIPDNWSIEEKDEKHLKIIVSGELNIKLDDYREFPSKAAGQLPSGFDISELYNSRFQPRGIQMALFGATDAIRSIGIDWDTIMSEINPDQVGVYSSSCFGQMDEYSFAALLQSRLKGERVSTKAMTMGINSMPTDFISAYVLGSIGISSSSTAACASFLSNLRHAISDIETGKVRVAIVGNSEAPITPECMDGLTTMGAIASDENMIRAYGDNEIDYRRASRPFGNNCGFTIGESSQYFVLMDDALAIELGAPCLGSACDVFIDTDGTKKSITAPGPGNHITMAKAAARAASIVGDEKLKNNSFVLAHGSSTPQNRVTESQIFDQVAKAFEIYDWPIVAVKTYLGHSIAPASADQLTTALGVFKYGILPGITTIDKVADDVYKERLSISCKHQHCKKNMDVAIINSKGFGGNNASAVILSPDQTKNILEERYDKKIIKDYLSKLKKTHKKSEEYFQKADHGEFTPIYRFGKNMITEEEILMDKESVTVKGLKNKILLPKKNKYKRN